MKRKKEVQTPSKQLYFEDSEMKDSTFLKKTKKKRPQSAEKSINKIRRKQLLDSIYGGDSSMK